LRITISLEDPAGIDGSLAITVPRARPVAHEAADIDILAEGVDRGQPLMCRKVTICKRRSSNIGSVATSDKMLVFHPDKLGIRRPGGWAFFMMKRREFMTSRRISPSITVRVGCGADNRRHLASVLQ
jgi:hypothetical protein